MTVALYSTDPVIATLDASVSPSIASPAFSPPAGTILVAAVMADSGGAATYSYTMSNSGTPLVWHVIQQSPYSSEGGYAGLFWAYNANTQSNITVTATCDTGDGYAKVLKIHVLTGADTSNPVAVSTSGAWTDHTSPYLDSLTLTNGARDGGMFIMNSCDWNASTGTPTTNLSSPSTALLPGYINTITAVKNVAASTSITGTNTWKGQANGHHAAVIIQPPASSTVNSLSIGSNPITNMMLGGSAVTSAYIGTTKIWG